MWRLVYLAAGMATFLVAYSVGTVLPLDEQEAEEIRSSFLEDIGSIDQTGIFLNNVEIALAMFIPAAGVGVGLFSGISTGVVFNAYALVTPELSSVSPLSIFVSSFGMLEVFAYGIAISRSAMLALQLSRKQERKNWKQFSVASGIEIAVVIIALIAGAVIEDQMIT